MESEALRSETQKVKHLCCFQFSPAKSHGYYLQKTYSIDTLRPPPPQTHTESIIPIFVSFRLC